MRIFVLLPFLLAASAASAQAPERPSPPQVCAVIQAVFASGRGMPADVYPKTVQPSREGRLTPDLAASLKRLGLSEPEKADLLVRAKSHDFGPFQPACDWKGRPLAVQERDGLGMTPQFTNPLFSSDGRLAVLDWSMVSGGRWGYGRICVARRKAAGWAVRCSPSWIA